MILSSEGQTFEYDGKTYTIGEQVAANDQSEYEGLSVPPKGKHIFGMVKVGDKGQIVIPAKARKLFQIEPGDHLIILGDEAQGLAIKKESDFLAMIEHLRTMNGE